METETYTITKYAGPKVAGRVHDGVGKTIELTEPQARGELLAGAIVKGKTGEKGFVEDPLAGSKKLEQVQANANPQEPPPPSPTPAPKAPAASDKG